MLRKKKKRRITLGGLKRKLWKVFSEYMRRKGANDNGIVKCISCDTTNHWKQFQAGHCIPKSLGLAIYFDERNVRAQCASCNLRHQGNQYQFMRALEKEYGPEISKELDDQRRNIRQIKYWEYEELIEKYEKKLSDLEAEEKKNIFGAR